MNAIELEGVILKLRGAAVLINAMGEVPGSYGDDQAPAHLIIEDAIRAAIDDLKALMEK